MISKNFKTILLFILFIISLFIGYWEFIIKRNYEKKGYAIDAEAYYKHLYFGSGYETINSEQLKQMFEEPNILLIDIRELYSFKKRHIKNSVSIHIDDVIKIENFDLIDTKNKKIVIISDFGETGKFAASYIAEHGYKDIYNLENGMAGWTFETEEYKNKPPTLKQN